MASEPTGLIREADAALAQEAANEGGPIVDDPAALVRRLRDALEASEAEKVSFAASLGFGDNVSERAATLAELIEPLSEALSDGRDHAECPAVCETCGDWSASKVCDPCNGSGCGPGVALGAYAQCEHCAGAGKVHEGCVDMPYVELAAALAEANATIERVEALAEKYDDQCGSCGSISGGRSIAEDLRRAIEGPQS